MMAFDEARAVVSVSFCKHEITDLAPKLAEPRGLGLLVSCQPRVPLAKPVQLQSDSSLKPKLLLCCFLIALVVRRKRGGLHWER